MTGRATFERDTVSGATGTLEAAADSYAFRNWGVSEVAEVATSTLDELIPSEVDLLKIDVEGHEEQVLEGAAALLERDFPIVLFECFHGATAAPAVLQERGYALYDAGVLQRANGCYDQLPRGALTVRWIDR